MTDIITPVLGAPVVSVVTRRPTVAFQATGPIGPQGEQGDPGPPGADYDPAAADARYVNITGDTVTGALTVAEHLAAAKTLYVGEGASMGSAYIAGITSQMDQLRMSGSSLGTRLIYWPGVDSVLAVEDDGTFAFTDSTAVTPRRVRVATPTQASHAVTKGYADGRVAKTGDTMTGHLAITNSSRLIYGLTVERTDPATTVNDNEIFRVIYMGKRATWTNEKGNLRTSNEASKAEVALKIIGASQAEGGTGNLMEVLDLAGNVQTRIGPLGRQNFNKGIRMVGDTIQVRDSTEVDESTISQALGGPLTIAPKTSLSVNNKKITSLLAGTAATDAVNKGQVDAVRATIGNLLTANQASVETDLTGISASSSIERITTGGYHGAAFVRLILAAAGDYLQTGHAIPVVGGAPYTFSAQVKMYAAGAIAWNVYAVWWDAAMGYITEGAPGPGGSLWRTDEPPSWSLVQATFIAPTNAAFVTWRFAVRDNPTAGDFVDVDAMGLWKGVGGDWAMPGEPIINQTPTAYAAAIGNLLTANQASVETDLSGLTTTGWANGIDLSRVATGAPHGSHALECVTNKAAYPVFHVSDPNRPWAGPGYPFILMEPNTVYTFRADIRPLEGPVTYVGLLPYASNDTISQTESYTKYLPANAPMAQWTTVESTFKTPPWATCGLLRIGSDTTTQPLSTIFQVDRIGFWKGAGGDWAMPGTPITGTGYRITHPNVDDVLVQAWDQGKTRWQTVHYDTGWRDITALISWPSGWSASYPVQIRRIGSTVQVVCIDGMQSASRSETAIYTLPPGFTGSASGQERVHVPSRGTFDTSLMCGILLGGYLGPLLSVAQQAAGSVNNGWTLQFSTKDALPTSLPGSLVSPAPYLGALGVPDAF